MNITTSSLPATTLVSLQGDITHAVSAEFQSSLLGALSTAPALLLDCSELNLLTSAGLRALLLLHREANAGGKSVCLVAVPSAVRDVMEVTGFWQHFTSYSTMEEALATLAS